MKLTLTREHYLDNGVTGTLKIEGIEHPTIYTLEQPWRDNQENISCIPKGEYDCVPHGWESNTKFHQKQCWELQDVSDRTGILIHSGNTTADVKGCILVGMTAEDLNGSPVVLQSRLAMGLLRNLVGQKPFEIEVCDAVCTG